MNIKHYPITNISTVEKIYSEKDGVSVKHVCTTEFDGVIADVFYRSTPHPEFGNKYFAILFRDNKAYIANADRVEDFTFGMVQNDDGDWEYSQSRHDYKTFKNGNMIDGGRNYIRSNVDVKVCVVRDGVMQHYGVYPDKKEEAN
jgi:hypothetical protein